MKKIAQLLLAGMAVIGMPMTAQAQTVEKVYSKAAVPGRTSTFDAYYGVKLDCTPIEWTDVRIVEQPQKCKAFTMDARVKPAHDEEKITRAGIPLRADAHP